MLLTATDLSFSYRAARGPGRSDDRPVLRGVSLALAAGEVVALLGPNGSGKSTLLRCLLGQLPQGRLPQGRLPSAGGSVVWDGKPVADWRPRDLARRVAYLPQAPGWDATQSVRSALALGRAPYWGAFGVESARDAEVVAEAAAALDLTDLLDRRLDELSGGQRQRVLLGRCLAQEPAALLLDEPNTYLDLRHQVDLAKLLRRLAADRGIGVLMASHDLNLAGAHADRLVLLDAGAVAADGPVDAILRPELLERVYGLPMDRLDRAGKPPVVVPGG